MTITSMHDERIQQWADTYRKAFLVVGDAETSKRLRELGVRRRVTFVKSNHPHQLRGMECACAWVDGPMSRSRFGNVVFLVRLALRLDGPEQRMIDTSRDG